MHKAVAHAPVTETALGADKMNFKVFHDMHKMQPGALYPLFMIQGVMQEAVLGKRFWQDRRSSLEEGIDLLSMHCERLTRLQEAARKEHERNVLDPLVHPHKAIKRPKHSCKKHEVGGTIHTHEHKDAKNAAHKEHLERRKKKKHKRRREAVDSP